MQRNRTRDKDIEEYFIINCKSCQTSFTEPITSSTMHNIIINKKELVGIDINNTKHYLLKGENHLHKKTPIFIFDKVLCVNCYKSLGKQIKSSTKELEKFCDDIFLLNPKKIVIENHKKRPPPVYKPSNIDSLEQLSSEMEKLIIIEKKFSKHLASHIDSFNTFVDRYFVIKNNLWKKIQNLENDALNDDAQNEIAKKEEVEKAKAIEKTSAKMRFSMDGLDKSVMYTEEKSKKTEKISFKIKNPKFQIEDENLKRKKF